MAHKTLYLNEMGMNDAKIPTDVKNHRVRVLENIDIKYRGELYNMFFEFCFWERYTWRTTNKRTGAPLKKAVKELVNPAGISIDTQFERDEVDARTGRTWQSSWRQCRLEKDVYAHNYSYTRADILKIINTYALEKYDRVVLVDEEALKIARTAGGYREKSIADNDPVCSPTDTWTDDHKVVRITERIKTPTGTSPMGFTTYKHELGASCEVDLVTGKISG